MSINKTLYSLRGTGLSQEDPSRHDCRIVDWDVKYQIKSIYDTLKKFTENATQILAEFSVR